MLEHDVGERLGAHVAVFSKLVQVMAELEALRQRGLVRGEAAQAGVQVVVDLVDFFMSTAVVCCWLIPKRRSDAIATQFLPHIAETEGEGGRVGASVVARGGWMTERSGWCFRAGRARQLARRHPALNQQRTDRWAHSVGSKICRDAWVGSGEKGARGGGATDDGSAVGGCDMMDMVLGS